MNKNILEARLFVSSHTIARKRIVKDYEIDIECSDSRLYTYNNKSYELKRGDVLVRTPGGVVSSVGMQKSYILTLDFSCNEPPLVYSRNIPGRLQNQTDNELITALPPIIHPRNPNVLFKLFEKITKTQPSSAKSALVDEIIYMLNADLAHERYMQLKSPNDVVDLIIDYMEKNLSGKITLDNLAAVSKFEKSYLIRYFKKATGETPFSMLKEMRLNRACDLLSTTDIKVPAIALEVGYNSTSFFILEYKKRFGITPEAHRKDLLNQSSCG